MSCLWRGQLLCGHLAESAGLPGVPVVFPRNLCHAELDIPLFALR